MFTFHAVEEILEYSFLSQSAKLRILSAFASYLENFVI